MKVRTGGNGHDRGVVHSLVGERSTMKVRTAGNGHDVGVVHSLVVDRKEHDDG